MANKSKVKAWWIVFGDGRRYPATVKNRRVFSGGDRFIFSDYPRSGLVAEMNDGTFEWRHNSKFKFMDYYYDTEDRA